MKKYTSFNPGKTWYDTDGNRIQAHGGSVLFHDGKFWWVGENKEKSISERQIWHWGVRLYSSEDLYNWKSEGIILPPTPDDTQSPLHPLSKMDRPHIIYNEKNGQFVMWIKIMAKTEQYMVIAVCDKINGQYTLIGEVRPGGFSSGDFDLVKDEDNGKAYIVFEKVHTSMIVMELNDDYTDVVGTYTEHFYYGRPPFVREAPAVFKRNRKWYMFTSGTTAKYPNPTESAVADDMNGPWTELGISHIDDVKRTSFDSQISTVIKIPGKDMYIAAADRWLVDLPDDMPDMVAVFDTWFDPDKEDLIPKNTTLTNKPTAFAQYVWLPVEFDRDGTPRLRWYDEWRIEDFIKDNQSEMV